MAFGRPSLYRTAYCQVALEVLGAGGSKAALAARLDVDKATIIDWERAHPDFSNAVARGLAKSEALWESPDWYPEMHPARWKANMANRFGWSDKTTSEITGKDGGAIKTDSTVHLDLPDDVIARMAREYLLSEHESDDGK